MKRCTKTVSEKHLFDYAFRGLPKGSECPREYTLTDEKGLAWIIPPKCIACGLIDDRPKKDKTKK